jgi:flagellar biosynthetic protein FliR
MDLLDVSPLAFQNYLLIVVRVSCFFSLAPFFGVRLIPFQVKILLSLITGWFVVSCLPVCGAPASSPEEMGVLVIRQVVIGCLLGAIAHFAFDAIRLAGDFIDQQLGFGLAGIIDPATQIRQTLFGELNYLIAIFLFMGLGGHRVLFLKILDTFRTVPLYGGVLPHRAADHFMASYVSLFVTALEISIPFIAILLIIDIISGLISRFIPQLNVLTLTFPFKISAGFLALMLLLPQVIDLYRVIFQRMFISLRGLL